MFGNLRVGDFFVHLLVDCVLIVLDCALFDTFVWGKQCYAYVSNYLFLITLQKKIGTVTVEGVENVGEENCIKIKTEEDYIQLVGRVKCEHEVSCFVVVIYLKVCVFVLYCTLYFVTHSFCTCISHLFSFCMSTGCTCVIRTV
jgi:hypothetical protein